MESYLEYRRRIKNEGKPAKEKNVRKIKPFSDKRAALNREYSKLTKPLWEGKLCEIKAPGCQGNATGMHHKRGKATSYRLLNTEEMIPACTHCNLIWIEENSKAAELLGFKLPRNGK